MGVDEGLVDTYLAPGHLSWKTYQITVNLVFLVQANYKTNNQKSASLTFLIQMASNAEQFPCHYSVSVKWKRLEILYVFLCDYNVSIAKTTATFYSSYTYHINLKNITSSVLHFIQAIRINLKTLPAVCFMWASFLRQTLKKWTDQSDVKCSPNANMEIQVSGKLCWLRWAFVFELVYQLGTYQLEDNILGPDQNGCQVADNISQIP